jgi:hypothetical protein
VPAVVLLHHVRCVLDRVTRLLVGAGLFEDMSCQDITKIMRAVWQQSYDGTATDIGIINTIALNDSPPGFVECGGIIGGIQAGLAELGDSSLTRRPFDRQVRAQTVLLWQGLWFESIQGAGSGTLTIYLW